MRAQPASSTPKSSNMPAAVGVLDSGVGGLSVLREIHRLLPDVPTLYYADQGHLPYGPKSPDEIRQYVEAISHFLIREGAVVIVMACHSASAASLDALRACYPHIPIVGMEPAVKPAAEATRTGVIGVLTTQATANGALYQRVVARFAADVRVITRVSPQLVAMVEAGAQDDAASEAILREHVEPLIAEGADQIVLACTHFPFLKTQLEKITSVPLVDPGAAVARQVGRVLPDVSEWQRQNRYFTSGSAPLFRAALKRLLAIDADVTVPVL